MKDDYNCPQQTHGVKTTKRQISAQYWEEASHIRKSNSKIHGGPLYEVVICPAQGAYKEKLELQKCLRAPLGVVEVWQRVSAASKSC